MGKFFSTMCGPVRRKAVAGLTALCVLAAMFGSNLVAFAQSVLPGSDWTAYGDFNKSDAPLFRTPQAALDYYFATTQATAPYNQECRQYFSSYYPQGIMNSARRLNGAWVFDCNLPFSNSGKYGGWFLGAPQTCSATSPSPACLQALVNVTAKSAGVPPCAGAVSCGNPINPGTGNKYQREDDFQVPGSPWLSFSRHYNSATQSAQGTGMGPKWRHSFDYQLVRTASGLSRLLRPDGSARDFNGLTPVDGEEKGALAYHLDATGARDGWTYDNKEGVVEHYDLAGRLLRIEFLSGGGLSLAYAPDSTRPTGVTDHFGRTVAFTYSGNLLTQVTSPGGRSCTYAYAATSLLLETANCTGTGVRRYVYDEGALDATGALIGQLTGIVDESGQRFANFSYDAWGRALTSEHAGGVGRFTVTYRDDGTAAVTTPSGAQQSLAFTQLLDVARATSSTVTCTTQPCVSPGATTTAYDAKGNVVAQTRADGSRTCTSFDLSRGLALLSVETSDETACSTALASPPAQSQVTQTEWHPALRMPLRIASPGQVVVFDRDAVGRITKAAVTLTQDNGSAGFSASSVGAPRVTQYTYNSFGQVTSVDGPRTDVSDVRSFAYDAAGNLVSETNELGQVTTYAGYDAEGRVGQITDPSGQVLSFQYDAGGRVASVNRAGLQTTFTYDARGLLLTETRPSGQVLSYVHDAAQRRIRVSDQRGEALEVSRSAAGGLLRATRVTAQGIPLVQLDQTLDGLDRVLTRTGAHVANHAAVLLNP